MTLRWRFALVLAISTIVASAAAGAAALWSTGRTLTAETDHFLNERLHDIPVGGLEQLAALGSAAEPFIVDFPTFGREGRGAGFGRAPDRGFIAPDLIVQIVDANGAVTLGFEHSPTFEVPDDIADSETATFGDVTIEETSYRLAAVPVPSGGALIVARDVTEDVAVLSALRAQITSFGVMLAAAAAAAGWFIAGRTVRPVEQLSDTARLVAETQDLDTPIEVTSEDEVGRLARSFNTMLEALRDSKEQQHRLVIDASHELRTPLTSLRTNIEVLLRSDDLEPSDRTNLLADVDAELRELTSLVSELVDLATDRRTEEPAVDADLGEIAAAVVDRSRRRSDRAILLNAAPTPVNGRPGQLDRAIWNLLDNAHKWSPEGAPIEVLVADRCVEVRDHGPGFADQDLPHVFERFYRATSARTLPGSGLGLAIVAQIVAGHGGTLIARNHPDGGAVVGFTLVTHPA